MESSLVVRLSFPSSFTESYAPEQREYETQQLLNYTIQSELSFSPDSLHFIGGDFARTGDLSVFWVLSEAKDKILFTPLVIELRNAPFKVQSQIAKWLIRQLPHFSGGAFDARGNGQQIAEELADEFGRHFIQEIKATAEWNNKYFRKLAEVLQQQSLIIPDDRDIALDLAAITLEKGLPKIPEKRINTANGQRHCDSVVALIMAIAASETRKPIYSAQIDPPVTLKITQKLRQGESDEN